MKFPKQVKKYCPKCKEYHPHKVSMSKTKPRPKTKKRGLKWGVRQMARVKAGHGGSPRQKAAKKAKTSTKAVIKYTCEKCNKSTIKSTKRSKKAGIV